ncbi:hypothetical protein BC940DRAFT_307920 [Gongronella butleri]|nr:hypothetical protein BC940DRAFT_307920 [Gongronella butleri]
MSLATDYDPLVVGTITGHNPKRIPHDHAIERASKAHYIPPNKRVTTTDPRKTLFVGRLDHHTTEDQLIKLFEAYGRLNHVKLVRCKVTGLSRGYGFVTFERTYAAANAYRHAHRHVLNDRPILVDYEFARTLRGWVPRRLGGGFGGQKTSGQLRFGCRDRRFISDASESRSKEDAGHHNSRHGKDSSRSEARSHHRPRAASPSTSSSRSRSSRSARDDRPESHRSSAFKHPSSSSSSSHSSHRSHHHRR